MPRYEFRSPRLCVDFALHGGAAVALAPEQTNYLGNVLRLKAGDGVLVFNGRDGEWRGVLTGGKRLRAVEIAEQTRPQPAPGDLHLLFAPLKHARLDYLVQKAVEMGASLLQPVLTQHTQVARINLERMRANVIEAAEQCGVLAVPTVGEPVGFRDIAFDERRHYIFCDEAADVADPVAVLRSKGVDGLPLAVLIGPEGGFSQDERDRLMRVPTAIRIALGPRILRADTAAVAALAVVQAALGDWRNVSAGAPTGSGS